MAGSERVRGRSPSMLNMGLGFKIEFQTFAASKFEMFTCFHFALKI